MSIINLRKPKTVAIQILQFLMILSLTLYLFDLTSESEAPKKDFVDSKPSLPKVTRSRNMTDTLEPNQLLKTPSEPLLENAAIVFLARNREVYGILSSMQNIEDRFNKNHGYPYIFLNDEPFTEEFKEWVFR
jgi:alpha 1,2-mannosyltransferase